MIVPERESQRGWRVATAVGFLAGMLALLDAVRDAKILWPPGELWSSLQHAQRVELGTGIALIVIVLVITVVRQAQT